MVLRHCQRHPAYPGSLGAVSGIRRHLASFTWRASRIGLFVSGHGILVRTFSQTLILPWQQIAGFEAKPPKLQGMTWYDESLWVRLHDGSTVETSVLK